LRNQIVNNFSRAVIAVLMVLPILTGGKSMGTGITPVPIHHFGGRAVQSSSAFVLDLDSGSGAILVFQGSELHQVLKLATGKLNIEPYGIALDVDGRFHVLGNRGRVEVTIDRETGSVVNVTDLEVACQGISNVGPDILLAPLRTDVGQSVLVRVGLGRLHPFGTLTSRLGRTPVETAITNLFLCGGGQRARVTCWWGAGEAAVFVLDESGRERQMAVPSLAMEDARSTSKGLGAGFVFPVRDGFFVDENTLWVLTNQEGALTPADAGAVRSRHLFRVGSHAGTIPLVREGRAILQASRTQVTVLYADGTLETLSSP
jgi:hypothetical protein